MILRLLDDIAFTPSTKIIKKQMYISYRIREHFDSFCADPPSGENSDASFKIIRLQKLQAASRVAIKIRNPRSFAVRFCIVS